MHHLDLGDEVSITSLAPPLLLFGSEKQNFLGLSSNTSGKI